MTWWFSKLVQRQKERAQKDQLFHMFQINLAVMVDYKYTDWGSVNAVESYSKQYLYEKTGKFYEDLTLNELKVEYQKLQDATLNKFI